MDRKKIEIRLTEFAREFGFLLPDGSFPRSSLFSQLVATPYRSQLWETVINKIQHKDKVHEIRKQILVSKLKSTDGKGKPQDCLLSAHDAGIEYKIHLWKKKEILTQKINEKRKQIEELKLDVYKKAESLQGEICKMAEIEKINDELKDNLLISNLILKKYKNDIKQFKKQIAEIKSFGLLNSCEVSNFDRHDAMDKLENIEVYRCRSIGKSELTSNDEENIMNELSSLILDRQSAMELWEIVTERKKNNLRNYARSWNESESLHPGGDERGKASLALLERQFMLDVTEYSLQAILNRTEEKVEDQQLKETVAKIEKLMFNKSLLNSTNEEASYLGPNKTGDSLTGRSEKMSNFTRSLMLYGMKKRKEFLDREIERIAEENKRNEHWTSERTKLEADVSRTAAELESLRRDAETLLSIRKESAQELLKCHNALELSANEIHRDFKEKNIFEQIVTFTKEIRKGTEAKIDLIGGLPSDTLRRIKTSSGKELYEFESLPHCLDHYGGELKEFFCSSLMSPYDRPESILAVLEDRTKFSCFVKELLAKEQRDLSKSQKLFSDESPRYRVEVLEKNYREVARVLSKILMSQEGLTEKIELIKKILKSWLEQPFRLMIPDDVTVDSMTLRQYEEKFQSALKEIKYYSEMNESFACK